MAYSVITVGHSTFSDYVSGSQPGGYTRISNYSPANATGIITTFKIYASYNLSGVYVGTVYGSSNSYTCRDYVSIGVVTGGSEQTFTGKNCNVSAGDFISHYYDYVNSNTGINQRQTDFSSYTAWYVSGNKLPSGGLATYIPAPGYGYALLETGVTVPDAPTNVSATDDLSDKITITWTAGTGETDGHRVYRDGVDVSGVVAHGTATFDDTPSAGTYAYTVKAINAAGLSAASTADNGTRVSSGSSIPVLLCSLGEY